MRISDWSSDVCSSDLWSASKRPRRSPNACGVQPGRSDGRIAMKSGTKIVLVALAAGALGVVASIVTNGPGPLLGTEAGQRVRSEEHTSELQSLMRISSAVFCLKKKKQ